MAISVDFATRVITVPQADLTFISGTLYQLDVDAFRLSLKDIEDSEDGVAFPDMHEHTREKTLSGTIFARFVEIINGYTVTFEDVASPYRVRAVGANHNISDVQNLNDVSLIIGNAAGLIVVTSGSGLSAAQDQKLTDVKAKTDQLAFTMAGHVDGNAKRMNDAAITGTGQSGDPWRGA